MENPFHPLDKDRYCIWEMLVRRDIEAFVSQNWSMIVNDFTEETFIGIDAGRHENPDAWKLNFPNLNSYRDEWLRQAMIFRDTLWDEDIKSALFRVTELTDIEINGDTALVHKKFFGNIRKADGSNLPTDWQTLYCCRKVNEDWKISGFTGFMPHLYKTKNVAGTGKYLPEEASQHKTAGPYSPVLIVNPGKLVVISGQAAIDKEGNVIGEGDIKKQSEYTLENCRKQLLSAGCCLDDVFKVNVYLTDVSNWHAFNEVYKEYFREPQPVRAAVQTGLLMNLMVEIEMWAVKS